MNSPGERFTALESSLKSGVTRPEPPAGHAASIMQAVRSARRPTPASVPNATWRWIPVTALALAILAVVVWRPFRSPQPAAPELQVASSMLELGPSMVADMPRSMVAPLSQEWNSLDQDLARTAQFLLASLP